MQDVCEADVPPFEDIQPIQPLDAIEALFCELDPTVGDEPLSRAEEFIASVGGWLADRFHYAGPVLFEDGRYAAHSASLRSEKIIH